MTWLARRCVASRFRVSVAGREAERSTFTALRALWESSCSPRARVEISVRKDCTSGSTVTSGRRTSWPVSRLRMMTPLLPTRAVRISPTRPSDMRSRRRGSSLWSTNFWVVGTPSSGRISRASSGPISLEKSTLGSSRPFFGGAPLSSRMRSIKRVSKAI